MQPKIAALLALLLGLTLVIVDRPGSASAQNAKSWLYLNSFQSQKLIAIDPATGRVESTIEVDDLAGSLGAAVTSDGRTLLIVDGDTKSRLRMLNAATRQPIAEQIFYHRLLLLGGGPTVHLTADDRWLFAKTYDYAAAAKGIRVFDIANRRFTPVGLRDRDCNDVNFASARDGRLIAICPGFLQELQPLSPNVPGEWTGSKVPTSIESPADSTLTSDGDVLYALGYFEAGRPWLLNRWTRGQPQASVRDLRDVLDIHGDIPDPRGRAVPAMALSPDAKTFAVVAGPHIWLVDSATMHVVGHWLESSPVDRPAFTRDGKEILAMRHLDGGRAELLRMSTSTRDITRVPLDHLGMNFIAGAATFIVAPAP